MPNSCQRMYSILRRELPDLKVELLETPILPENRLSRRSIGNLIVGFTDPFSGPNISLANPEYVKWREEQLGILEVAINYLKKRGYTPYNENLLPGEDRFRSGIKDAGASYNILVGRTELSQITPGHRRIVWTGQLFDLVWLGFSKNEF